MDISGNIQAHHSSELCRAVCAIVHANINENRFFQQSGIKMGIPPISKYSFTDNGVRVELDRNDVKIRIHVNVSVGESSICQNAAELQRAITEEVVLLTSIAPKEIDVIITGINVKKTH